MDIYLNNKIILAAATMKSSMALKKQTTFWYFCFCCYILSSYSETDTLKQGYQLKNGEYLVSAGKVFTLGIFNPLEDRKIGYFYPENAQVCYIGIWYTYDISKRPVWIANRNKPISKTSGALKIDSNGDFKILDKSFMHMILKSNGAARRVAVLTDTGNLELRELNPDGSVGDKKLWQSFDYPTDTLLLGMRLGFNFKTGHKWSLTSWVSDKLPALGPFTLGIDPNSTKQLIMWIRGEIHWRSGVWHNGEFPNLKDYLYKFDYVSNSNEIYFTLSTENAWDIDFPMYKIDGKGAILHFDNPTSDRSQYSRSDGSEYSLTSLVECRHNDYHLGCVKQKLPECRKESWFDSSRGTALSEGFRYEKKNHILGVADCGDNCLRNCYCVAYASIYPNGTGCEIWTNITQLQEDGYASHSHRVLYIQRQKYREEDKRTIWWVWLIVATAIFLLLLALALVGYHMQRTLLKVARCFYLLGFIVEQKLTAYIQHLDRLWSSIESAGASQIEENMSLTELGSSAGYSKRFQRKRKLTIGKKKLGIQVFGFESIVQATDNFSPSNRLGQGGYGIVYKGISADNQEIAIKRLSRTSKQGRLEFMNEVKLVAKLQHNNLVKLIGCCIEQGEKILVYEYMQNKSLDYFLFDSGRKLLLDWKKRFNIIEGVAQGLLYLHKYSRLKIIHRDLKTGNILLDQEMNPKISDFGMARLFRQNESGANTNRIVGTL